MNTLSKAAASATFLSTLALFALIPSPATAHEFALGELAIDHPWSRELPAVATTGIAYLSLQNGSDQPRRLTGASSPVAASVSLHDHVMDGNMMRMAPMPVIEIPPGQTVMLEPGGLHIMLTGLTRPMAAGTSFPLTLEFANGETLEIVVNVESLDAQSDRKMDQMKHHEMPAAGESQ